MAVNPLEGLKKVAANHQLDSSFTEETQVQEPGAASSPASVHRHRQNICCTSSSSSHGPRVWSKCGSRTNPCTSCWSVVQSRSLRSQHSPQNAARERNRVRSLREAFHSLQAALPSVPPDTKLSKLDVLVLATNYIAHLTETLDQGGMLAENTLPSRCDGYLHPVKKWPMRSLLYCGSIGELLSGGLANQTRPSARDGTQPLTQPPIIEEAEKE